MKVSKIDHVGIIVDDLKAATAFFLDLGLEVEGEAELEGELVDRITGLHGAKSAIVYMRIPGAATALELAKFKTPSDESHAPRPAANTLGIRHIAIQVEDLDGIIAKLKAKGLEMFSEVQNYEDTYKTCYVRGPEGIILELAESLK